MTGERCLKSHQALTGSSNVPFLGMSSEVLHLTCSFGMFSCRHAVLTPLSVSRAIGTKTKRVFAQRESDRVVRGVGIRSRREREVPSCD
jgi:hypothetical protein